MVRGKGPKTLGPVKVNSFPLYKHLKSHSTVNLVAVLCHALMCFHDQGHTCIYISNSHNLKETGSLGCVS